MNQSPNLEAVDFDKTKHYSVIKEWWSRYGKSGEIPEACVPKHGVMILSSGKPMASCFLYINDTKLCHLDFCIVNPDLGAGKRVEFLRIIIAEGIYKAKAILGDDAMIWSLTDHSVVARIYNEIGFRCLGEGDCFVFAADNSNIKFLQ